MHKHPAIQRNRQESTEAELCDLTEHELVLVAGGVDLCQIFIYATGLITPELFGPLVQTTDDPRCGGGACVVCGGQLIPS
jgi:hypothetical protein